MQARRPANLRSGRAQTFFVPDTGHPLERVDFITAVEELDGFHFGDAAAEFELLGLELVVVLAGLEELLQKGAVRDADFRPILKLRFVQPLRFSQGARPAFFRISILPVRARQRQLFRRSAETVLRAVGRMARTYRAPWRRRSARPGV